MGWHEGFGDVVVRRLKMMSERANAAACGSIGLFSFCFCCYELYDLILEQKLIYVCFGVTSV